MAPELLKRVGVQCLSMENVYKENNSQEIFSVKTTFDLTYDDAWGSDSKKG